MYMDCTKIEAEIKSTANIFSRRHSWRESTAQRASCKAHYWQRRITSIDAVEPSSIDRCLVRKTYTSNFFISSHHLQKWHQKSNIASCIKAFSKMLFWEMLFWEMLFWEWHFEKWHFEKCHLLMQSLSLQTRSIWKAPVQFAPPSPFGSGLLQKRVRASFPGPQGREHSDQDDHWPKPPFPVVRRRYYLSAM